MEVLREVIALLIDECETSHKKESGILYWNFGIL